MDLFDAQNPPTRLNIKVTPKARQERIKKEAQPDGTSLYRVYVTAAPEDGKANEAVIRLLAEEFNVPKSTITILRGHTSREKVVSITRL